MSPGIVDTCCPAVANTMCLSMDNNVDTMANSPSAEHCQVRYVKNEANMNNLWISSNCKMMKYFISIKKILQLPSHESPIFLVPKCRLNNRVDMPSLGGRTVLVFVNSSNSKESLLYFESRT